jgi:hypothetical protein
MQELGRMLILGGYATVGGAGWAQRVDTFTLGTPARCCIYSSNGSYRHSQPAEWSACQVYRQCS